MRAISLAVALVAGCGPQVHSLDVVPSLPAGCAPATPPTEIRVSGLGDFPLDGTSVGAASAGALGRLSLPRGTRVIAVEGLAPGGLVAFGRTGTIDPMALGPDVAIAYGPPDAVCAAGAMLSARAGHRATLLPSGDVLISGGVNADGFAVTSLELYVPAGDALAAPATFRQADSRGATVLPQTAVLGHAVAVLPAGDFVITGGAPALGGVASGPADAALQHYTAAAIADGPVLHLDGGGRAFHTATTLADGRVLIAGGCDVLDAGACVAGRELDSVEIYDPSTGRFAAGFKLKHARWDHDAILRGDGSVLLVGGRGAQGLIPPVEIYDPDEDRAVDAGAADGRAALLATGGVFFAGGGPAPSAGSGVWLSLSEGAVALPPLPIAVDGHTVTALDDGTVLVAGGLVAGAGAPLTLYDATGSPRQLAAPFQRRGHTATRLLDGTVLLAGGTDGAGAVSTASIYLRSPLGPYSSLPALVLDAPSPPYQPRARDRATVAEGRLSLQSAQAGEGGRPGEFALVAGARFDGFTFDVAAGRAGTGAAAIVFGFESDARYAFVVLDAGKPVTLSTVSVARTAQSVVNADVNCVGVALAGGELPDGATAALTVTWRLGVLDVSTPSRTLLHCTPVAAIARGAVGVASLHGTVAFDGLTVTR